MNEIRTTDSSADGPQAPRLQVDLHAPDAIDSNLLRDLSRTLEPTPGAQDLRWLLALRDGLRHQPYCLVARNDDSPVGILPLAFVSSRLFGRYLVSLPYVNSGGVQTRNPQAASQLVEHATELANDLQAKHLELRHETKLEHPALTQEMISKVHMRLCLPETTDQLWNGLKAKVRNQVRKGEKQSFKVQWGGEELLPDFYTVFSSNMRDLGTPVFGKRFFRSILSHFDADAELCVLQLAGKPVAGALLIHGAHSTEVPSASSLRAYNSTNANMYMYWQLLERAVERGQRVFDFGRSSKESNTHRFKKQWGAVAHPAVWQYYVREGNVNEMRPENSKYDRAIRVWRRLPLWLTRVIGPPIVRGIP